MRLVCAVEGLGENWVDLPDAWRRSERGALMDADMDGIFEALREKCTGCRIEVSATVVITDPKQLTDAALEDADLAVYGFVVGALFRAMEFRSSLGNRSARLSSPGSGARG